MPTFLSPLGALVALAAVLPLAGALVRERRLDAARRVLRLEGPGRGALATAIAGAAAVLLLALAAAQPALSRNDAVPLRTDAQAYVILDTSRSMAAVAARGGPTRFERARRLALRLRDAFAGVPWGVASFTDRTLVHVFPTGDRRLFADTLAQSVGIRRPAPTYRLRLASNLGDLADGGGYFLPGTATRLWVLFTDGESRGYRPSLLVRQLRARHIRLVLVRVWGAGERVFDRSGRDLGYRPDPASARPLAALADAGVPVVPEHAVARLETVVRKELGTGPSARPQHDRHLVALAPALVLASILPLGLVAVRTRR